VKRLPATVALLALAFAGRLANGLSQPFWTEDERQVYLIGLRAFARGDWPYFGADVVWTGGQLPGALQGLLIRWPLALWQAPEAPIVLLNLLSFGALALLAWYLRRRVPETPGWLIWIGLFTLPWTLNFSTHIVNTSYVLPGAIVFFVGFLEGAPAFRTGALPLWLAWAGMGAGLCFVVQMHMSWVLLPPYVIAAAVSLVARGPAAPDAGRVRPLAEAAGGFALGSALTGSVLAPTLLTFGWAAGGADRVVAIHPRGPIDLLTVTARVLSFASFETNRFLGLSSAERVYFLWREWWAAPFVLIATLVGLLQPIAMAITPFVGGRRDAGWTRIVWLTSATILWVYASFFFSVRGPLAHSYYVVFPIAATYAVYCWPRLTKRPGVDLFQWTRVAAWTLASGVVMHAALAIDKAPRQSLYVDRALVVAAIAAPNDRFLGDRRDSLQQTQDRRPRAIDPVPNPDAYLRANPDEDLTIVEARWAPVVRGRVSRFVVRVRNRSAAAAYLDLRYATEYLAAGNAVIATREGVIKQILQPGEARTWSELTDGFVPSGAAGATIHLTGAEKCIPLPRSY
jgi:hypothetical protein